MVKRWHQNEEGPVIAQWFFLKALFIKYSSITTLLIASVQFYYRDMHEIFAPNYLLLICPILCSIKLPIYLQIGKHDARHGH